MGWLSSTVRLMKEPSDLRRRRRGFGRTPRRGSSTLLRCDALKGLRRSTRYGVLLYLGSTRNLTSEQKAFLAHQQEKLNSQELNRALKVYSDLRRDERYRARLGISENTHVPAEHPPPRRTEQRRIGIGYRDKGALRPPHRPRLPGEFRHETVTEEQVSALYTEDPTHLRRVEEVTADIHQGPFEATEEPFLPSTPWGEEPWDDPDTDQDRRIFWETAIEPPEELHQWSRPCWLGSPCENFIAAHIPHTCLSRARSPGPSHSSGWGW